MSANVDINKFVAALTSLRVSRFEMRIGFNAEYAAAVHEVLTAHHEHGQAKFLEVAMQRGPSVLSGAIRRYTTGVKDPAGLIVGLTRAVLETGLMLLGDAQQLCPVKTGFLQNSGTWEEPRVS